MSEKSFDSHSTFSPARSEWFIVFALLLGGLFFNVTTYNLYPTVWSDEVLWSEPAINLIKTGHFTTSVWEFQPAGSFWAAQSPLYCFVISGWMRVFGTDLLGARSFDLALITVAVLLTWLASWRCKLISRPTLRILIIPLLLMGYGLSFSYRCSRPDILGMICLLCLGLSFFIRQEKLRLLGLFVFSFAAPWIGIQVALYTGLVCILAKLFFKRLTFRVCILMAIGVFLGSISMLGFYHAHGVLGDFIASVSQASKESQHWGHVNSYWSSIPRRLNGTFKSYTGDYSLLVLLCGLFALGLRSPRDLFSRKYMDTSFLMTVVLTIPIIFMFIAHFAFYYTYMIYVPSVLIFLCMVERVTTSGRRFKWPAALGATTIVAACLFGLPMRLLISSFFYRIVPRAEYAQIIQSVISQDDMIFADYTAFFECKAVAHDVYSPMYSRHFCDLSSDSQDFTDEEKRRMTVLVIPVVKIEEMKLYWGGEWTAVTPPLGDSIRTDRLDSMPFIKKLLKSYLTNPQGARQPIQVFRRAASAPAATGLGE